MTPADVVANVAHGRPRRRATSPPATACWSTTITVGENSVTATSSAGSIERASGIRKSSHRSLSAAAPRTARARSTTDSTIPAGAASGIAKIRAPAGSSGLTVPGCAAHATS